MLQKMNQVHGKGKIYLPPKNNYETHFGIQHFAGVVYYDSKGISENINKGQIIASLKPVWYLYSFFRPLYVFLIFRLS